MKFCRCCTKLINCCNFCCRDDVTAPSLADLKVGTIGSSKPILFAPLESTEEVIKEESLENRDKLTNGISHKSEEISVNNKSDQVNASIHIKPVEYKVMEHNHYNKVTYENIQTNGYSDSNFESTKPMNKINMTEKVYITMANGNMMPDDNGTHQAVESCESTLYAGSQSVKIKSQSSLQQRDKTTQMKSEKVCINIKTDKAKESDKCNQKTKLERSDTLIKVAHQQAGSHDRTAVLNELATAISERQAKPKEVKPVEPVERPQANPLTNFCITTYTSSKPVEIYKEKSTKKEVNKKELTGIYRRNSSAEEKKGITPVKRSASVVTNLQRRLDLSR